MFCPHRGGCKKHGGATCVHVLQYFNSTAYAFARLLLVTTSHSGPDESASLGRLPQCQGQVQAQLEAKRVLRRSDQHCTGLVPMIIRHMCCLDSSINRSAQVWPLHSNCTTEPLQEARICHFQWEFVLSPDCSVGTLNLIRPSASLSPSVRHETFNLA